VLGGGRKDDGWTARLLPLPFGMVFLRDSALTLALPPGLQVLASLASLLSCARFQPSEPLEFGNRVVERLLRLAQVQKGEGLHLKPFADVVRVRWGERVAWGRAEKRFAGGAQFVVGLESANRLH